MNVELKERSFTPADLAAEAETATAQPELARDLKESVVETRPPK